VIAVAIAESSLLGEESREGWLAFSKFSDEVMRHKEDAERAREAARLLSPVAFDPG